MQGQGEGQGRGRDEQGMREGAGSESGRWGEGPCPGL